MRSWVVLAVALAGCGDDRRPPPQTEEVTSFPAVANPDLDLLFLIDDYGAYVHVRCEIP